MEDEIRKQVAILFEDMNTDKDYISLDILDKLPQESKNYTSMNFLDSRLWDENSISLDILEREFEDKNNYIDLSLLQRPSEEYISQLMLDNTVKQDDSINMDVLDNPINVNDSGGEILDNSLKFDDGIISLNFLENPIKSDSIVNLNILDKPLPKEKCHLLSPLMECNVGGFAHVGCMDYNFHTHCKFKTLHEKRSKLR